MTSQAAEYPHETQKSLDIRGLARFTALLALALLPVLLDRGAIASAVELYGVAKTANPYWIPSHALLLYVRAPLVGLSASFLVMSPGLLLAIAAGMTRTVEKWVLAALMLSVVVVSLCAGGVQSVIGTPLVGVSFVAVVLVCTLISLLLAAWRVYRAGSIAAPWRAAHAATSIGLVLGIPYAALCLLAPKFYWDSLNGDGAHTFESARLLLSQPVPFWNAAAGAMSSWPGITTMLFTYPASWFIRLFGEVEASVRIPWVVYLSALFCGIVAVAEVGGRRLSRVALCLVGMGVATYATTMAFSATYSPYWADIALPATQDTLMMAALLAYVVFFAEGRVWWMGFAQMLVFFTVPSGQILIAMWLLATLAIGRRISRPVMVSIATLALSLMASAIIPRVLASVELPLPGGEHNLGKFVRTYAYLQLTDWRRLLFVAIPCGILPAMAVFTWRRNDQIGKALVVVTVGYFVLWYVRVNISLHHFVPAMVFPLAIFWRAAASSGPPRPVLMAATAATGLLALGLSLPQDPRPHLVSREIGFAIEDRVPGYSRSAPAIFRRHGVLARLFPIDWERRVPDASFGGSPLTWIYYSNHRPATVAPANYVLQVTQCSCATRHEARCVGSDGRRLRAKRQAYWPLISPSVRRRPREVACLPCRVTSCSTMGLAASRQPQSSYRGGWNRSVVHRWSQRQKALRRIEPPPADHSVNLCLSPRGEAYTFGRAAALAFPARNAIPEPSPRVLILS